MKMKRLTDLFRGSNSIPRTHSVPIMKPTLLHIGFILKFYFVGRWLPGATNSHLPWIYTAPEKPHCVSCAISESITLDRTLQNVLFGQAWIMSTSNIQTSDIRYMCRKESFSKKSQFTFNKMRNGYLRAEKWITISTCFKPTFPVTTLVIASKNGWSGGLFAWTNFICYLAFFI